MIHSLSEPQSFLPYEPAMELRHRSSEDHSVQGAIAKGIYEFLDAVAIIRKEIARNLVISLWMDLYPMSYDEQNHNVWYVQTRLSKLLMAQVQKSIVHNWNPRLIQLLMQILGIYGDPHAKDDSAEHFFRRDFFLCIQESFEASWLKDSEHALGMLPPSIRFDSNSHALIQTWRDGHETILPLKHTAHA